MIEIRNLRHRSLDIPSLAIPPGRTAVIGLNGSGKTTFLSLCVGIALPQGGSILLDGRPPRETDVGWVAEFPDRNMLFDRVSDEIASPLRFRFVPAPRIREAVERIAADVGISGLLARNPRSLSGGEKTLVALATALVSRPVVLVLDEFDSHLDAETLGEAERAIGRARVPYVLQCTQNPHVARSADRVLYMEAGRVRDLGALDRMFRAGDADRAAWELPA
ncbi:MAG: ABC transporter ATP-binding protein [Methanomicrobiales archaeon]|nr:ABC transporter ATP-binding protein [Methanomicrobiales archaeon]MDI6876553.1 ABC transporter ATP-binding protein [Methanomicrobiales archaeon]